MSSRLLSATASLVLSDAVSTVIGGKVTPLELITREARARRTVVIYGYELNGSSEVREIEPYWLRRKRRGLLLYFGCLKRRGLRCLYVQNIVRAQVTGRHFTPRRPIELS
jgi:predicted DNA-binding transcriptional regulator YafY